MGYFVKKRGRPTGIPWPARGGEKKMGAAWRPWPGLAEAGLSGGKTDYSASGNKVFVFSSQKVFSFRKAFFVQKSFSVQKVFLRVRPDLNEKAF